MASLLRSKASPQKGQKREEPQSAAFSSVRQKDLGSICRAVVFTGVCLSEFVCAVQLGPGAREVFGHSDVVLDHREQFVFQQRATG